MPQINWYPGHMAKSRRLLQDQLRAVDAVVELCDARAPLATRNPDLEKLTRGKARILVLNKADLADDAETTRWIAHFRARGLTALRFNSNGGKTKEILSRIEEATRPAVERAAARGMKKTVRLMVIGIPNVGKSTFINRLHGSGIAKASDRPGVTRSNQWVKIGPYLELLDTPGLLWPKLSDQRDAQCLAFVGTINDQVMDQQMLAIRLLERLMQDKPDAVAARFKLKDASLTGVPLLEEACRGRGWLLPGAVCDTDRGAAVVLDEFRAGKLGRISLQQPPREG